MQAIQKRKPHWIAAGLITVAAIVFLLVVPRLNRPQPRRHSYFIAAGGVARAIVQDERANVQVGRFSPPRLPHHIDFQSSGGPIDVYVIRYPSGGPRNQIDQLTSLTEQLKSSQPPPAPFAQGSGERGRIDLHWWPYGAAKYVVLVRAERESEVHLTVHYGP